MVLLSADGKRATWEGSMSRCYRCGAPASTGLCGACRLNDDQKRRHSEALRQQERYAKEQAEALRRQEQIARQQAEAMRATAARAAPQPMFPQHHPSSNGHPYAQQPAWGTPRAAAGGGGVVALVVIGCAVVVWAQHEDEKKEPARKALAEAQAEEAKKQAAAKHAAAIVDAKSHLGEREFIPINAQNLRVSLKAKSDPKGAWATTYGGKYVRWDGKFDRTGYTARLIAATGENTLMSCRSFNATHDEEAFSIDRMDRWTKIRVEGRLDDFDPDSDGKYEFVLTDCIATRLGTADAGTPSR